MTNHSDIIERVRQSAATKVLFLPHAVRQIAQPDRMISTRDVRHVIEKGEIIENYPEDARDHSCLLLAFPGERPIHVVCSPKDEYLAIITAYIPNNREWEDNYRIRKKI